jgi:hypothetical protein
MVMLTLQLLSWWYGQGWKLMLDNAGLRVVRMSHMFSVPILVRTLWAPWRRIVSYPGASLDQKLRAIGDNLVSRLIGFTVRFLVLLAAGIMLLLTAMYGMVLLLLWPLVPLLIISLIIKGAM